MRYDYCKACVCKGVVLYMHISVGAYVYLHVSAIENSSFFAAVYNEMQLL